MYDVEKHAIWLKVAADAMHGELLRQCDELMGAEAGTDDATDLARIAAIVSEYEEVRWPIDQTPIQKQSEAPMSLEPRMWIDNCSKCNGRLASHVKPAFANAVEYIRADEVEQLKGQLATAADILRRYRNLPVGGYGQLLGSGAVDEAADAFLETQ